MQHDGVDVLDFKFPEMLAYVAFVQLDVMVESANANFSFVEVIKPIDGEALESGRNDGSSGSFLWYVRVELFYKPRFYRFQRRCTYGYGVFVVWFFGVPYFIGTFIPPVSPFSHMDGVALNAQCFSYVFRHLDNLLFGECQKPIFRF